MTFREQSGLAPARLRKQGPTPGLKLLALVGAVAMPASPVPASARPQVPPAAGAPVGVSAFERPLSVFPLRGGAYWVSGGIANSGFVVGDKGVILIDAEMTVPVAKAELAEIAKITPKTINKIILTHSDPDHINGLPAYPAGLEIIAQENAKREIEGVVADPHSNGSPPPAEIKDYVPTHAVKDQEDLVLDGVRLRLLHVAPAHTDGDLVIYLPALKIVYAGDLLTPAVGPYPGIHLNKHGSFMGWAKSVRAMLALDADVFVSGHGAPQTRADVEARLRAAEMRFGEIKSLVDQHKTLDEIKAALHDAPPTGIAARFPTFTETTYRELTATRP